MTGTNDGNTVRFALPDTVSAEAQAALTQVYAVTRKFVGAFTTEPADAAEWDRRNARLTDLIEPVTRAMADRLKVAVTSGTISGLPILRITPPGHVPGPRALVYTHGGGYVALSAGSTLGVPALMAAATGIEVVSIDYTLAPHSRWRETTGQVVAVYRALLERHRGEAIGMFGDSAGGGLIAGSVLRMRDEGLPLPGALYLLSPWFDVGNVGDSFLSLADVDPSLDGTSMGWYARAYAAAADHRHPYVSPVHGDYGKPYPPTLIQGGTREILLSDFVRGYQAIRSGGHDAVLDLYEGMPHVFQGTIPAAPESRTAIRRAADFFAAHLAPALPSPTNGE